MSSLVMVRRGGEGGFTLVELMISLAILAVGIMGVIGMYVTAIGGNAQGRNLTEATALAQEELNRLTYNVDYDDLGVATGTATGLKADGTAGGRYTRVSTVAGNIAGYQLSQITVTVSWTAKEETHSVSLTSFRSKE